MNRSWGITGTIESPQSEDCRRSTDARLEQETGPALLTTTAPRMNVDSLGRQPSTHRTTKGRGVSIPRLGLRQSSPKLKVKEGQPENPGEG
jgi:hypothetical protein